ncbi:negative elongation factor D-like [Oscarella lobularis]|uniref:negative elongation factor D-like n=1 Tax=Oscarella lobularis TaxID=121494 RepID=UPI0033139D0E
MTSVFRSFCFSPLFVPVLYYLFLTQHVSGPRDDAQSSGFMMDRSPTSDDEMDPAMGDFDAQYAIEDEENEDDEEESVVESAERVRSRCLNAFSEKDAIMEPSVFAVLRHYFQSDGKPEEVVQRLSESYVGFAQATNVLVSWLGASGVGSDEIDVIVYGHLKELVRKHFDPRKADSIFIDSGATPTWLEKMIAHQTWRELFYELAEQYPECVLLNFAIKLISDAGYQSEITSGATASHQIDVFTRLLKTSIAKFLEGGESVIESHIAEFSKVVFYSQHTLLYTEAVLHAFASEPTPHKLPTLRRLIQELQLQDKSTGAMKIGMFMDESYRFPRVLAILLSILSRNSLTPGDIVVLHEIFSKPDPPPVEIIRIPRLFDLLVNGLFKPNTSVRPQFISKYAYLLAYMSSVQETWEEGGRVSIDSEEMQPTLAAISRAQILCQQSSHSPSDLLSELAEFYELLTYPSVSMGVLRWVQGIVADPNCFNLTTETTPVQLVILDEICSLHPLQRNRVLSLLISVFEVNYPDLEVLLQLRLKKIIMDRIVHVFSCGHIRPVLSFIQQCLTSKSTDLSLIRHFVVEVLQILKAPYSAELMNLFMPIVSDEDVTKPLEKMPEIANLLVQLKQAFT